MDFLSLFCWSDSEYHYGLQDLNIGGSIVAAAISEATGTPRAKLRDMYNNMGDLGTLFSFPSVISRMVRGRFEILKLVLRN